MLSRRAVLLIALLLGGGVVAAPFARAGAAPQAPSVLSSTAERIYEAARPRLLQIRTLLAAAGRQSSLGSGFLVSADGLAITNYHVVSQYILEPGTYRLEYTAADGSHGELRVLALDLADDLALIRLDRGGQPFFQFDAQAVAGELPKGERLYSMGNPLDLGFTIVEGTYNGLVERSYNERVHFSGAINPGMSGGPTVTADGQVAGINVAKELGGELVSFLVPARFARALLDRTPADADQSPKDLTAEIGRQFLQWQAGLYQAFDKMGFRATAFGPYEAPESPAPWFTCWARTNVDQIPKPRATVNASNCNSDTRLFIASDLISGLVHMSHAYVRSVDLNAFQFAAFLSQEMPTIGGARSRRWYTPQRCHEDFLAAAPADRHPPLRAVWCARAYRAFPDLYDVSMVTVTQDRADEALVSQLSLQGTDYANAVAVAKRFVEGVQWKK